MHFFEALSSQLIHLSQPLRYLQIIAFKIPERLQRLHELLRVLNLRCFHDMYFLEDVLVSLNNKLIQICWLEVDGLDLVQVE